MNLTRARIVSTGSVNRHARQHILVLCLVLSAVSASAAGSISPQQAEFFEQHIRPFLANDCYECHGAKKAKGGLRVDFRDGLLKGGESGPAIVPGKPMESLLIQSIHHTHPDHKMPKDRPKLSDSTLSNFIKWVNDGAPDPRDHSPAAESVGSAGWESVFKARQEWWSFQPIKKAALPAVKDIEGWEQPVDRFIKAKLEGEGIRPAPLASPQVWLRRVHFAITGLPPTIQELQSFLNDSSQDARAKVVNDLLNSPHFGERWARYWMDLIRFAETYGHEQDYTIPHVWQYRDYLIRAFNSDVPYPQFVKEHLAGDLLKSPRRHPTAGFNESVIGTGWWYLHQATHAPVDPLQDEADRIDNQIDVFSKTFLGLTVACARCHDHKFDAISTQDYYSLTAFLRSSRQNIAFLDPDGTLEPRAESLRQRHSGESQILEASLRKMRQIGEPKIAIYLSAAQEILQVQADSKMAGTNGPAETSSKGSLTSQRTNTLTGPIVAVAARKGLNASILGRWVKELSIPAAQKSPHPLQPWLEAVVAESKIHSNNPASTAPRSVTPQDVGRSNAPVEAVVYTPFQASDFKAWFASGQAFTLPAHLGDSWRVGSNVIDFLPARVAHSGRVAGALQGTLRSPTFTLTHPNIHLRLAGEAGRVRLVISRYGLREFNALLFEKTQFDVNTGGAFTWHSINSQLQRHVGRPAYFELIDAGDGYLALDRIVFSQSDKPPSEGPATACQSTGSSLEQAKRLEATTHQALDAWIRRSPEENSLPLLSWLSQRGLLDWGEATPAISGVIERMNRAAEGLPAPLKVLAMTDGSAEATHVFVRGDPKLLGPAVNRRSLEAVSGSEPMPITTGSGRLELAEALLSEGNPFLYRVIVNRVWAHLFGRGLVATVDNLGSMGRTPSHPELLDYLALTFRENGGSIKQLIRTFCLTRTFQMSSSPNDAVAEARDADNALLHRMRLRRLEGEAIRDNLLAVSGQLNRTQFGPSVPTYFTPFMGDRMWVKNENGPMDGNGRRSLYQETRRNFLSPWMLIFDLPLPDTTVGQRNSSNVPGQALALMNDPLVKKQAEAWAKESTANPKLSDRERVQLLFLQALARPATTLELEKMLTFLQTQANARELSPDTVRHSQALWADACHVVFMMKEFIHVP